jgi:hypothetical protein
MATEIVVALIAGVVSFVGLVITKEQTVSGFRQEWINALRNDIAKLMKELHSFYMKYLISKKAGTSFIQENLDTADKIIHLLHKIELRLNPNDSDGLIELLKKVEDIITSPSELEFDGMFEDVTDEFKERSHELLKQEWERVKKGEQWFHLTKMGILIISSILVLFLVGSLIF